MTIAAAVLYALFVWWFSTGLVLLLVLRRQRRLISLVGAAALVPVSLYLLGTSGNQTSVTGAYVAFTAAILLWGAQEIAFLTGFVTGPRAVPCPPGSHGAPRLRAALGAILYHEVALLASGAVLVAVTWSAANQVGTLTFLVLWVMRLSAKLNLFLGVPVLNDEILPSSIAFLRSYFRRGPVNGFFPFAIVIAVVGLSGLVTAAMNPQVSDATRVGYVLVAALMVLAILEHVFMLLPLPIDRLWAWSTGQSVKKTDTTEGSREVTTGEIDRVVVTSH